ncbi:MAG: hypothetical protein QOF68_2270 [Gaiellales bacterium]|jgi:hypothetical protein|nr:hypothetical protein [Gaiellales bacterium]
MLLFRSEEDVVEWCQAHGRVPGAIMPLGSLQRLARSWYGDRLDPNWQPRSRAESQALLDAAGLSGSFWQLP